jgi:predicted phage terminase large subunit-like protein
MQEIDQTDLEDTDVLETALEAVALRADLYAFVKAAWPIVEPAQPFVENWHIKAICQVLQDITLTRTECQRFIFNVPPGTLKSLLISVLWPAWVWARSPRKRFLTASYGSHLTIRDNLRVRDIVISPWFQARFRFGLVEDQNTKTRYNTSASGWRIATSVGGVGTGEHPDFIIIDDPLTAQQAESEPERTAANNWFDRTMSTRGTTRRVVVIIVMQRLHEDDLTGHLLARGGVEHICFPMRYERCSCPSPLPGQDEVPEDARCAPHRANALWRPDPRDPRTREGELLFPRMFPERKVKQLELDLGPYGAAGQLQQRPSPEGGGQFKREWFGYLDVAPKTFLRILRGWDTAGTENGGDWTRGVLIGEYEDGLFAIVDVKGGQLSPAGVDLLMLSTANDDAKRYGPQCGQREEREGGASGKAQIASRAKLLVGHDYKEVSLGTNKVIRAKPFRAQCEAGNVKLVRGAWNEEYITELCGFPTGKFDDQVDGSSTGFNSLLLEPKKRKVRLTW